MCMACNSYWLRSLVQLGLRLMGIVHPSRCFPLATEMTDKAAESASDTPTWITLDDLRARMIMGVKEASLSDESFLGKGTFGRVSLVTQNCSPADASGSVSRKLALKRPTKDPEHETLSNERNVLMKIDHPNIIKLFGICEVKSPEGLLLRCQMTEYCCNGELFQLIVSKGPLSEDIAKDYFFQILKGLNYLHKVVKLVHRDLKPENILLTNDLRSIKICDLGTAVRLSDDPRRRKAHGRIGSLSYAAPEVYIDSVSDFSSDIWSAGVILYVMFCVASPFRNSADIDPENSAINRVKKGDFNRDRPLWKCMPREPKNLILRVLNLTSKKRPTAAQLLNYNWFSKLRERKGLDLKDADIVQALVNFSAVEPNQKDCWLAVANQLGEWEQGDYIFDAIDSNHDGIVDRFDLLRFKASDEDIDKILPEQGWISYSEVIGALLMGGIAESAAFSDIIPFAYEALRKTGKYSAMTYATFTETILQNSRPPRTVNNST